MCAVFSEQNVARHTAPRGVGLWARAQEPQLGTRVGVGGSADPQTPVGSVPLGTGAPLGISQFAHPGSEFTFGHV